MCVVSMVSGHFQDNYASPLTFPPQIYPDYLELIRKAKLYDEMTNQKDCPDPKKVEWQNELEKIMFEKYGLKPNGI